MTTTLSRETTPATRWLHGALGVVLGIVLAACGSSSADSGNTSTGPSDAEFAALQAEVATLETRIDELSAALETLSASVNVVVARDSVAASKGAARASKVQRLADAEAIGCAFTGHVPANQFEATTIQCKTPNGYAFNLAWPGGGAPLKVDVFYLQDGCMGTPYTPTYMVEDGARLQGVVATYHDGVGAHVGMVAAGAPVVAHTVESLHNGSDCFDLAGEPRDDLIAMSPHTVDAETGVNATTGGKNSYPEMTVQ